MATTQFLGAFNDNLFKQLLLLLATPAAAVGAAAAAPDRQAEATIVFAAAFLLFSGVAGWLADRTSKSTLIVASKAAEIVVMIAGMIGFYLYAIIGFNGMLVVLFLMGVQSAVLWSAQVWHSSRSGSRARPTSRQWHLPDVHICRHYFWHGRGWTFDP